MAFLTMFLQFAGSIARLATVLIESDDFLFNLPFMTGTALNTALIAQFALYWSNTGSKAQVNKVQAEKRAANKLD